MNCKPDDLAIVVYSQVKTELGMIVRCLQINGQYTLRYGTPIWDIEIERARMVKLVDVDTGALGEFKLYVPGNGSMSLIAADKHLRPIRGDETPEELEALLETEA